MLFSSTVLYMELSTYDDVIRNLVLLLVLYIDANGRKI